MELKSASMPDHSSSKLIRDLDWLSLNELEGTSGAKGKPRKKNLSSLSLNIPKSKVTLNSASYNIREDYDVIETLGMGTYAFVRSATEKKTGRHVAIKTCRGETSRVFLKNEYNLLKRLADDNIIQVYDLIEDKTKSESYLIMEYFEGSNLDEYVSENGAMSEADARLIIKQLLNSLQYLHELGIAHRDIKPENILINQQKEIKVIDFNISKSKKADIEDGERKFTSIFYTQISSPLYCAPELKNNIGYTESIDIWGVGIVLFTLLFGTFSTNSLNRLKTQSERHVLLVEIVKEQACCSEEWKNLLLSMLSSDAEARPTCSEALGSNWMTESD